MTVARQTSQPRPSRHRRGRKVIKVSTSGACNRTRVGCWKWAQAPTESDLKPESHPLYDDKALQAGIQGALATHTPALTPSKRCACETEEGLACESCWSMLLITSDPSLKPRPLVPPTKAWLGWQRSRSVLNLASGPVVVGASRTYDRLKQLLKIVYVVNLGSRQPASDLESWTLDALRYCGAATCRPAMDASRDREVLGSLGSKTPS
ncbi:hypothetical protein B0H66DRAFT_317169 [Apodospora peruviana]|uniref:Uncharacterized protein n=1 Tax=Apodospora peruviana TaxID=516989 RepID=A0AAE0HXF9_9PEZI|nr:hypothetical protein B0H66DRAFT_317169 [Apodospora peruviana]